MHPRLCAGLVVAAASPTAVHPASAGRPGVPHERTALTSPAMTRTSETGRASPAATHGASVGMAATAAWNAAGSRRPRSSPRSSGSTPNVSEKAPSSAGNTRHE